MVRAIFVADDKPSVDRVGHRIDDTEAVLQVGDLRIVVNVNDLADVRDATVLADKLALISHQFGRGLEARATQLLVESEQRVTSAGRCTCGFPDSPNTVHRTDGPCHVEDRPVFPNSDLDERRMGQVVDRVFAAPSGESDT